MDENTNKVINFPTPDVESEGESTTPHFVKNPDELTIEQKNTIFYNTVKDRIKLEVRAIKHTASMHGQGTTFIEDDLEDLCMSALELAWNRNEKGYKSQRDMKSIIAQLLQGMTAIFSGQPLAPIYGADEEWENITTSSLIGQTLKIPFRGQEVEIEVESVQVNKRLTSIFRFNNDNRYAHRRDFFQFWDVHQRGHVITTDDSVRYLQFPYDGSIAVCQVEADDKSITNYIDFTAEEIQNEIIFSDLLVDPKENPYAHVFASPIPFFMLEDFGIDLDKERSKFEAEIQKTLNEVQKSNEENPDPDPDSEGQIDEDALGE